MSDNRKTRYVSVCLEGITPITTVHALENRPFQSAQGCFSEILDSQVCVCFSPICIHRKGSPESISGSLSNAYNNPSMARPTMVSKTSKMIAKKPTTPTSTQDLLKDPTGKLNPIVMQNSLRLVAWTISDRTYLQKEYHKGFPTLLQTIDEHLQSSITSQLGRSGVAGVLNGRYLL